MPELNSAIIGLFERLLWGITLLRRKHVSAEATTAMAADTESCCASIRQQSPHLPSSLTAQRMPAMNSGQ